MNKLTRSFLVLQNVLSVSFLFGTKSGPGFPQGKTKRPEIFPMTVYLTEILYEEHHTDEMLYDAVCLCASQTLGLSDYRFIQLDS